MACLGILVKLLLFSFLRVVVAHQSSNERPNILLLFPDQWRFDFDGRIRHVAKHVDHQQSLPLELPNIRRLIRTGTHFLNCYTPSPLCAPGRAAVASGRDYDDAGVADNTSNDYNTSIPTFFTALGKAGYHVMTAGKDDLTKKSQLGTRTHQGDWRGLYHQVELGFDDGLRSSGKLDVVNPQTIPHERFGFWLKTQPPLTLKDGTNISAWDAHVKCMTGGECSRESFPDNLYEDDWVTRLAIQLLHRKPMDRPWFLQVNFPGPHPPFLVTPRQHSIVDDRVFPPPVDNSNYTRPQECKPIDRPVWNNIDRCSYAAECEHLDYLMGTILEELDRMSERNKTIVCFSSDHGEMLEDHGLVGKLVPWQGSVGVPLICAGPDIRSNQVVERAVSTKDLAATFLDYAGLTHGGSKPEAAILLPPPSTSKSLRLLLESGHDDSYHTFIRSGFGSWRMVVDSLSSVKLICCRGLCKQRNNNWHPSANAGIDYQVLIYNTTNDPFDMNPLNGQLPRTEIERLLQMLPDGFCGETTTSLEITQQRVAWHT